MYLIMELCIEFWNNNFNMTNIDLQITHIYTCTCTISLKQDKNIHVPLIVDVEYNILYFNMSLTITGIHGNMTYDLCHNSDFQALKKVIPLLTQVCTFVLVYYLDFSSEILAGPLHMDFSSSWGLFFSLLEEVFGWSTSWNEKKNVLFNWYIISTIIQPKQYTNLQLLYQLEQTLSLHVQVPVHLF